MIDEQVDGLSERSFACCNVSCRNLLRCSLSRSRSRRWCRELLHFGCPPASVHKTQRGNKFCQLSCWTPITTASFEVGSNKIACTAFRKWQQKWVLSRTHFTLFWTWYSAWVEVQRVLNVYKGKSFSVNNWQRLLTLIFSTWMHFPPNERFWRRWQIEIFSLRLARQRDPLLCWTQALISVLINTHTHTHTHTLTTQARNGINWACSQRLQLKRLLFFSTYWVAFIGSARPLLVVPEINVGSRKFLLLGCDERRGYCVSQLNSSARLQYVRVKRGFSISYEKEIKLISPSHLQVMLPSVTWTWQ